MSNIPSSFIVLFIRYFAVSNSFALISSLSSLPLSAMTFVLTVQMLKLCSSQTDVEIQLCVPVLYAITQCCPLIQAASPYFVTVPWLTQEICFQADDSRHADAIMHLICFSVICINVI